MSNIFAIGIPTLNRYDLLGPTIKLYSQTFYKTEIHILDNGHQNIIPESNTTIHVMASNIGVAASWNFLCKEIFRKHSHALILNDDINLGESVRTKTIELWCNMYSMMFSELGWCAFLISKNIFEKVGLFDERFYPAYFEDNDYCRRMDLKNIEYHQSRLLNPAIFNKSMTLQKDRSINNNFIKNQEYYTKKWGGLPGQEKYSTAFNK